MAFKCTKVEYVAPCDAYQKEIICDTEADVANLPACAPGSTAIVVDSGAIYMVNASGQWVLFGG